jgi:hypothetical protein
MGDAADDARDTEEMWHDMKIAHKAGTCEGNPECPYCDPDFKPFFAYQVLCEEE